MSTTDALSLNYHQVIDMDWKFGVTASSDELNEIGACFLHLKLTIDQGNNQYKNILMEMSLKQFYQFFQQMQKASRECQSFLN